MKIEKYEFPDELLYVTGEPGHFWIKKLSEDSIRIGVDNYASSRAGEIEFVRTMQLEKRVKKDQTIGTYESGKWVGQIVSPISGIITEKNNNLKKNPNPINEDPYGEGWLLCIQGKDIEQQIKDNEKIVPVGEKLEEFILWRISQE